MSTLAIIGTGAVGATIAYAAMMRGVARQIVLVDAKAEKARAESAPDIPCDAAEREELVHSAQVVRQAREKLGFS